ncbi:UDP-N-acetylmuramoyl-tripeptide--D-alanyl-D-alanine ligase [[Haemophilus] felis]|uniref:UDP-N-acetylmuramoyl-tripeptide--D-alanyl-D-alanine ligase n=1 Tax=[Haemophilus] felis TaxID=123822 RepID=A0A1T0BBX1_9PAST|nr:UDP-N-acetylmuramoyl-tripeptide--D-alanyl-D-alanine ligase [[Haemophilus] felis]NBI40009.1 UDP-N-acetylmuramoyl-tripeptide--D-alanyl-D-alanine ligase [[Haemophilus] felis]OOS07617.1 UDP-N-acetylmuramoyl-tripeptide--D-alanyl-D-alanine ligase [[Haemophilus] felis]
MIKLTTQQVAEILGANFVGDGNVVLENVSTDSRKEVKAGLFFALSGEKFDAHDYVVQAVEQGCVAVVVAREMALSVPQIIVEDTRLALGQLAKWLKNTIKPKTVAMTGSSGKTTVKEMTAKILQQLTASDDEVLYTFGNLNNDLGVPLTLLRLTEQHKFAVVELGANHMGEIAYTTDLVQPNVALVNNVAAAHLEGFGSLAGVAQAKGEIYRGLAADGVVVINKEHNHLALWRAEIGERQVQFFAYQDKDADFYAENVRFHSSGSTFDLHTPQGVVAVSLPYLGEHNVKNAVAATALAMNVGADLSAVQRGLAIGSTVKGRLFAIPLNERILLLDDTYNANVDSLTAAIKVLQGYQGYRILVVGDMAELGEQSATCHQQVAKVVAAAQLDLVLSFGEESAVISQTCAGKHFTDKAALCRYAQEIIQQKQQNIVLLAKGSRRIKMEDVIHYLKENLVC